MTVNLGDVVEVLDPLFSPTVYQLRLSVYFVVLPSVKYRGVFAAFQYSSFCIHGFLMVFFANDCDRDFSLVHESLHDPSYLDWVEARTPH